MIYANRFLLFVEYSVYFVEEKMRWSEFLGAIKYRLAPVFRSKSSPDKKGLGAGFPLLRILSSGGAGDSFLLIHLISIAVILYKS
jgi:hypothetical protein